MKYTMMNGQLTELKQAAIPVMDHGFLYGIGLFETLRTYQGKPSNLGRHLERMAAGCAELGIPFTADSEKLERWIVKLLAANGLEEAYIRYTVSAGAELLGLPSDNYSEPNHIVFAKALPAMSDEWYEKGKALQLLRTRRNTPEGQVRFKSLHYMNNILAKRELMQYEQAVQRQAEGLMLTPEGSLAEGMVSNLFFVKDEMVFTPELSTGILPGITREVVLEVCKEQKIPAAEGLYTWEALREADEIFMSSSIQELVPITTILDVPTGGSSAVEISQGRMGPITRELLHLYRIKAGRRDATT
ncbi:aminotransferase class IV [Paenibacillus shunpengii]|uniref:Aminotransferase class IV n=1 Tax=Paenibacillus shunpengii TaxID=2054424 RepID=A0ABW5SRW4_9BACL